MRSIYELANNLKVKKISFTKIIPMTHQQKDMLPAFEDLVIAYADLIEHYHIDKMEDFQPFEELKRIDREFKDGYTDPDPVVFNLPDGETYLSNVLEFSKDTDGFHPTQKPVALIRRLVLTYTNEGDTVLDNCMGSGTTAIACIKERRHFIGFELSKEYFDKAVRRIKAEQAQLTLF